MAASPSNSANLNLVTKDAMFLFDLFRESPTPILIQIGPFAEKTGAKPNTIIKRLSGIKARNGLNITTTLGDYKRPSPSNGGNIKVRQIKKSVKKENLRPEVSHVRLGVKEEINDFVCKIGGGSEIDQTTSSPITFPSSAVSSPLEFHQPYYIRHYEDSNRSPNSVNMDFTRPKREFQETLTPAVESERSELDGRTWKRVKVE